MKDGESVPH